MDDQVPDTEAVEQVRHPDRELTDDQWRERIRDWWHAEISPDLWEKAVQWLKDKWGDDAKCPFCEAKEWRVQTRLTEQTTWATTAIQPALPVVCGNCGYIVYIDAGTAGLVLPENARPER